MVCLRSFDKRNFFGNIIWVMFLVFGRSGSDRLSYPVVPSAGVGESARSVYLLVTEVPTWRKNILPDLPYVPSYYKYTTVGALFNCFLSRGLQWKYIKYLSGLFSWVVYEWSIHLTFPMISANEKFSSFGFLVKFRLISPWYLSGDWTVTGDRKREG